jgi:hypothetical protein
MSCALLEVAGPKWDRTAKFRFTCGNGQAISDALLCRTKSGTKNPVRKTDNRRIITKRLYQFRDRCRKKYTLAPVRPKKYREREAIQMPA